MAFQLIATDSNRIPFEPSTGTEAGFYAIVHQLVLSYPIQHGFPPHQNSIRYQAKRLLPLWVSPHILWTFVSAIYALRHVTIKAMTVRLGDSPCIS